MKFFIFKLILIFVYTFFDTVGNILLVATLLAGSLILFE